MHTTIDYPARNYAPTIAVRFQLASLAGAALLLSASLLMAEEPGELVRIQAIGQAVGIDTAAQQAALTDAFAVAVKQACGQIIESTTYVAHATVIEDRILARAKGYVSKHTVLQQWVSDGVSFSVIDATVSRAMLEDDLRGTLDVHGNPRVMLIVAEGIDGNNPQLTGACQARLERLFKDAGVRLLDRTTVLEAIGRDADFHRIESNLEQLAARAATVGAELLVYVRASATSIGQVKIQIAGRSYEINRWKLNMTARVIRADSGEVVSANSYDITEPHKSQGEECGPDAFAELAAEAGPRVIKELQEALTDWPANPKMVPVVFEGCRPDEFRKSILPQLRQVDGVVDIQVREGIAKTVSTEFSWRYPIGVLAERIAKIAPSGFQFTISSESADRLIIQCDRTN